MLRKDCSHVMLLGLGPYVGRCLTGQKRAAHQQHTVSASTSIAPIPQDTGSPIYAPKIPTMHFMHYMDSCTCEVEDEEV